VTLPFTFKKNNCENSNISPCKNIIFKKILPKETKILQDHSRTNLKFQHKPKKMSSFENPHIKIDLLSPKKSPHSPSTTLQKTRKSKIANSGASWFIQLGGPPTRVIIIIILNFKFILNK
jgi:hypothetical protein